MILQALGHALSLAAAMAWEILWALILGFAISTAVQAVVSKAEMSRRCCGTAGSASAAWSRSSSPT